MKYLLILFSTLSFWANAQVLPQNKISGEFESLNKLEQVLLENPNTDTDSLIKEIQKEENIKLDSSEKATVKSLNKEDTKLPSFLMGCGLSWIGILLVYILTDNDKAEVSKAVKGCIFGTVAPLIVYGIIVIVALATSASTGY